MTIPNGTIITHLNNGTRSTLIIRARIRRHIRRTKRKSKNTKTRKSRRQINYISRTLTTTLLRIHTYLNSYLRNTNKPNITTTNMIRTNLTNSHRTQQRQGPSTHRLNRINPLTTRNMIVIHHTLHSIDTTLIIPGPMSTLLRNPSRIS